MLQNLAYGFSLVFQPFTFALMVFGTAIGVVIGALPGLTASMGIILLLPLVYRLPANVSLVMLCGLFCGGMYGGSISAILLNTPGTPSASATTLTDIRSTVRAKRARLSESPQSLPSVEASSVRSVLSSLRRNWQKSPCRSRLRIIFP